MPSGANVFTLVSFLSRLASLSSPNPVSLGNCLEKAEPGLGQCLSNAV